MPNHSTQETRGGTTEFHMTGDNAGIEIHANQAPTCFTLYQDNAENPDNPDMIHVCNWPELREAIDAFQAERNPQV